MRPKKRRHHFGSKIRKNTPEFRELGKIRTIRKNTQQSEKYSENPENTDENKKRSSLNFGSKIRKNTPEK